MSSNGAVSNEDLHKTLAAMNKRLDELQADNTMLKITVNNIVERLSELEGTRSTTSGSVVRPQTSIAPKKKKVKKPTPIAEKPQEEKKVVHNEDNNEEPEPADDSDSEEEAAKKKKKAVPKKLKQRLVKHESKSSEMDISDDRITSYYVGKRKVYVARPSDAKSGDDLSAADSDLQLEFIYGYNGSNSRHNLFYIDKRSAHPRLLYSVAATGVHYDPLKKSQSFFIAHDEDILSMAIHPTKTIAATGQLDPKGSGKPYICVWDYSNMKELARLSNFHDRAVCAVAFSADGEYIISVGEDDNHTAALWQWEEDSKKPVTSISVSKDAVYGLSVNPFAVDSIEFVTFGVKHLKVWTMEDRKKSKDVANKGPKFIGKIASSYNKTNFVQKAYYSALFVSSDTFLAGAQTGDIYVFDTTGKFKKGVKNHEKAVGAMTMTDRGFASAGSDGKLVLWNQELQPERVIDLGAVKARAMDFCPTGGGSIVVGTSVNSIVEISLSDSANALPIPKMEGHYEELWALAVHPTLPIIATGGHDKVVRCWDYKAHATVPDKVRTFKGSVRSATFSPDGRFLALGFKSGKIVILNFETFQVEYEKKHRAETIDAIVFSPNGQLLALGSWDQVVELIDMETHSSIALKGHTSSVTHLTFSVDSKYLMSDSRDYEKLYWDCETGRRCERDQVADVQWHDWQCILGWPVQGIFGAGMDGTDVNALNISGENGSTHRAVAVGDDFGKVILYKYPCTSSKAEAKKYMGHSSHVTSVRFSPDDTYLFSTGGADAGVFQWRHRMPR